MFLNTSSRVIRLRLILSHLRGPRPAGCLVASSPGRNLLLLLGLVAVGRVVSEALILWTLETGLALALAPAAARPLGLPTDPRALSDLFLWSNLEGIISSFSKNPKVPKYQSCNDIFKLLNTLLGVVLAMDGKGDDEHHHHRWIPLRVVSVCVLFRVLAVCCRGCFFCLESLTREPGNNDAG
jgi:hypothetical protein